MALATAAHPPGARSAWRRLGPLLALLLVAAPVFFWGGRLVDEEAIGFLQKNWGERGALQKIFDVRGWDYYQGRELSYAIDYLDAQWLRLLASHDVLFFVPPSAVLASLAFVVIGLFLLPRALPHLGAATRWLGMLVLLSNFVCLPYTLDLTEAGIHYACRSLPHTFDPARTPRRTTGAPAPRGHARPVLHRAQGTCAAVRDVLGSRHLAPPVSTVRTRTRIVVGAALAVAAAAFLLFRATRPEPRLHLVVAAVQQPATSLFYVAQASGCLAAQQPCAQALERRDRELLIRRRQPEELADGRVPGARQPTPNRPGHAAHAQALIAVYQEELR